MAHPPGPELKFGWSVWTLFSFREPSDYAETVDGCRQVPNKPFREPSELAEAWSWMESLCQTEIPTPTVLAEGKKSMMNSIKH